MGKRAKRARTMLKKMSILGEKIEPKVLRRFGLKVPEENSVMQEKVKKEVPSPVIEEPKEDIVEEMIKEVEEMVEEIKPTPKRKPRARRKRTSTTKKN